MVAVEAMNPAYGSSPTSRQERLGLALSAIEAEGRVNAEFMRYEHDLCFR